MVAWSSSPGVWPAGSQRSGSVSAYTNALCANSSHVTHVAELDAAGAPGSAVYYRVSGDGGASWSPAQRTAVVNRAFPQTVALWGDMAVQGVNAPVTSAAALAAEAAAGTYDHAVHIGDAAYNMEDLCGELGDKFLDAAQAYASAKPLVYGNGNHETGPDYKYLEFVSRLGAPQSALAAASGSPSPRYLSWSVGPVFFFSIDADAWIYPLVYELAQPQWLWLNATLAAVDRAATPWVVGFSHRAMYCTKTTDGECNSEAQTLRYGFLEQFWGLEALLLQYSVDFVFAGQ